MRTRTGVTSFLLCLLVICGCGGGGGGGPVLLGDATLFVGDVSSREVLIWRPDDGDGNVPPDGLIGGVANTQFDSPYGLHYDSRTDTLVVGDFHNSAVKFFDGVTALLGDVAPTRTLSGPATLITASNAYEVFVDELRNLLYLSHDDGVFVFANADTLDGNVAPTRNITGPATGFSGNQDKRLFLDAVNDRLYVLDSGAVSLMVYDNASAANGNVAPNRTVSGASTNFNYPWGVAVDVGRDILYVADETNSQVYIFDGASTLDGNVAPDRIVSGLASTLAGPAGIDVDPATDSLYVPHFPGGSAAVSVWTNASTVNGDAAPNRTITGVATGLSSPQDVTIRR